MNFEEQIMFKSIYIVIGKEEYEGAVDPTYSYFPCVSPGKDPETGKSIEVLNHYAKHKYVYGAEIWEAQDAGPSEKN